METRHLVPSRFLFGGMEGDVERCHWIAFRRIENFRVCFQVPCQNELVKHLIHPLSFLDFGHLPLFAQGFLPCRCSSAAINQPVPVFPDPPEDIVESFWLKDRADPVNEEHGGQIGDDEIVAQDNAQVQVTWHKSSFWG